MRRRLARTLRVLANRVDPTPAGDRTDSIARRLGLDGRAFSGLAGSGQLKLTVIRETPS